MDNFWAKARELIAQGQLPQALAALRQHLGAASPAEADLILFQARLSQAKRAEMLLGSDSSTELNRLTHSVLDYIGQLEKNAAPPASKPLDLVAQLRSNSLQQKIRDVYALLEQWEQKQLLSDNPTEIKRCEAETQRLQSILDKYLAEWAQLNP